METIAEQRHRHAKWAKNMAEQYRQDAQSTQSDYWRNKWLKDAQNMESEANWAEQSAEYMDA